MNGLKLSALILLSAGALALISCGRRTVGRNDVIPMVRKILKDTSSAAFRTVSSYNPKEHGGPIVVIGTPTEALRMTEDMITSDRFDNVDGRAVRDSLPDFAGETFSTLLDVANSPYSGYFTIGNEGFLREAAVLDFLSAMDTVCAASPYDTETKVSKPKAKVVVLASSILSAYGYYDIDTIVSVAGGKVPILSTVRSMYNLAWARHGDDIRIGIWSSPNLIGNGVYSTVLEREGGAHPGTVIEAFSPDTSSSVEDRFMHFMEMYSDAGDPEPMDVLLLDDPDVDVDELRSVIESLAETEDIDKLAYSKLLGKDFECIDAGEAISSECFRLMREKNCFTHKIAYPAFKPYITVPAVNLPVEAYMDDGSLSDEYKFNRAPDSGTVSFMTVEMKDRYVPESIISYMQEKTPNTYSLYVR